MATLLGGNSASAQAKKQQQLQQIADDRQLAQLNQNDQQTQLSARNPRGRRLFSDASSSGAGASNGLQTNLS